MALIGLYFTASTTIELDETQFESEEEMLEYDNQMAFDNLDHGEIIDTLSLQEDETAVID